MQNLKGTSLNSVLNGGDFMNHGQYLINKSLRKELELYKRVQKTKGFAAKETTLQAMWVDKILSIRNKGLISWR